MHKPTPVPTIFGLPNIAGTLRVNLKNLGILGSDSDGAFYASEGSNDLDVNIKSGTGQNAVMFSAAKSNNLYGSASTNQPNALRSLALIRAY